MSLIGTWLSRVDRTPRTGPVWLTAFPVTPLAGSWIMFSCLSASIHRLRAKANGANILPHQDGLRDRGKYVQSLKASLWIYLKRRTNALLVQHLINIIVFQSWLDKLTISPPMEEDICCHDPRTQTHSHTLQKTLECSRNWLENKGVCRFLPLFHVLSACLFMFGIKTVNVVF